MRVRRYVPEDRREVFRLLMELHGAYRSEVVPPELAGFSQEKDPQGVFERYFSEVEAQHGRSHLILVLEHPKEGLAGFIIGSVEHHDDDVLSPAGIIEDWFVVPEQRGRGGGKRLYQALEQWFRSRGCRQVRSDTWVANRISIAAHRRLGFAEYTISFRKRLPDAEGGPSR